MSDPGECYYAICGSGFRRARFAHDDNDGYNPASLSESDVEWMENFDVVGFNPDANGISKVELHNVMQDPQLMTEDVDYRKLFLWLDHATTPKHWMDGPFLAVANRRRIWGVCEQLADTYHARLARKVLADEPEGMAELILEHADNPQIPLVVWPPPSKDVEFVSVQWVRSLDELTEGSAAELHAFFGPDGSMVGLAMELGGGPMRVFGQDDGVEGVRREMVEIEDPADILGLILHIPHAVVGLEDAETSIKGVTVQHRLQDWHLGSTRDPSFNLRPLLLDQGKTIVGLSTRIIRLGLLQCTRPPSDDFALLNTTTDASHNNNPTPIQHRLLWRTTNTNPPGPIWTIPHLRLIRLHDAGAVAFLPENDMLACEPLLWARTADDIKSVTRLSVTLAIAGTVDDRPLCQYCNREHGYYMLCGAAARRRGGATASSTVVDFDVDGAGGEVVDSVEMAWGGYARAVKLHTNRDREVVWGDGNACDWVTLTAPPGQTIVGLVFVFGNIGGGDVTGIEKYAAMTYAGILALPLE
ncbi:f-box domain protein [Diplodia corticola]|uniref:F-box domain protein n=1 Tax=Diplodia corticola TaxID=236234 RepID=A0A1J9RG04_9PEZI|nr:f-box domain protein [Diplodia corticola]OJD31475.1 f-box domain protein [Diplodia corticola]